MEQLRIISAYVKPSAHSTRAHDFMMEHEENWWGTIAPVDSAKFASLVRSKRGRRRAPAKSQTATECNTLNTTAFWRLSIISRLHSHVEDGCCTLTMLAVLCS